MKEGVTFIQSPTVKKNASPVHLSSPKVTTWWVLILTQFFYR